MLHNIYETWINDELYYEKKENILTAMQILSIKFTVIKTNVHAFFYNNLFP